MVRRRAILLVAVALLGPMLAGCIGGLGGSGNTSEANSSDQEPSEDSSVKFQQDAPESAKTSDEHRHPQWQGETVKTLFDDTVQAGDCYGIFSTIFFTVFDVAFQQRVEKGCAEVPFDNGTLVPQGTEKLKIEVDASQARQRGGYDLWTWTGENSYTGPTTTQDQKTWWIELSKHDWDGPHQSRSSYSFLFRAQAQETGGIAHLEGPMDVTIEAHKIENWTAPLAAAHLDHWQLKDRHTFVNEDAIEVLNRTETVYSCTWVQQLAEDCRDWDQQVNLSDIIPPGSKEVVLAITWPQMEGCAPAHDCDIEANLRSGGSSWTWGYPEEEADRHVIYLFNVPDQVPPDSTYANESETVVEPSIDQCMEGPEPASWSFCGLQPAEWSPEANATFYMEAWRTPVDVDDFKQRRGLDG